MNNYAPRRGGGAAPGPTVPVLNAFDDKDQPISLSLSLSRPATPAGEVQGGSTVYADMDAEMDEDGDAEADDDGDGDGDADSSAQVHTHAHAHAQNHAQAAAMRRHEDARRARAARLQEEKRMIQLEIERMEETIPALRNNYRVVDKIGEGTFASVYRAVDLRHEYYDNSKWTPAARGRGSSPCSSDSDVSQGDDDDDDDDDVDDEDNHNRPGQLRRRNRRGSGKSKVYVALKRIYATSSPARILNELEIMASLRSSENICYLITALRCEDQIVSVMPYTAHADFRDFYRDLSMDGLRAYLRCLFNALSACHSANIIHRDVKPANFLFDPTTGHGTLCDFGLAERWDPADWRGKCHHHCPSPETPRGHVLVNLDVWSVHTAAGGCLIEKGNASSANDLPGARPISMGPPRKVERVGVRENDKRPSVKANRAGTRGFRAPEVLFKCEDQTPAIDVWSVGIILLSVLTRRFPMFNANTDMESLLELTLIFGQKKMSRAAVLHNRTLHCTVPLDKPEGWSLYGFVQKLNPKLLEALQPQPQPQPEQGGATATPDAQKKKQARDVQDVMDLLRVCLHIDVTRRHTAQECLQHPFITGKAAPERERKGGGAGSNEVRRSPSNVRTPVRA